MQDSIEQQGYLVPEFKVQTFQDRVRNLNKKMADIDNGQIVYSVLGTIDGTYIDKNGDERKCKYYKVDIDGAVKFKNMELISRLNFPEKDKDTVQIKPLRSNLSKDDIEYLGSSHDRSCACCSKKIANRKDLFAFKCMADTEGPNGTIFKAGEYYQIGTSCVGEFIGKEALKAVSDLVGPFDERKQVHGKSLIPKYYDMKLLAKYALVVGELRLDEAYKYYMEHPAMKVSAFGTKYNMPVTYRQVKSSMAMTNPYGYNSGNIIQTAKKLYCLNEFNDGLYNYDGMFISPRRNGFSDAENYQLNKQMMSDIATNLGFWEKFNSPEIDEKLDKIFEDDANQKLLGEVSNRDYLIASNVNAAFEINLLRDDYCQMITDICDEYLLKHNEIYMHEDTEPLFKRYVSFRTGDVYFKDMFGKYRGKVEDTYDSIMTVIPGANSYKNDRLISTKQKFNIIPDNEIPIYIKDADNQTVNNLSEAFAESHDVAQSVHSGMSQVTEDVTESGDRREKSYNEYEYKITSLLPNWISRKENTKTGQDYYNVRIPVPEYVSESKTCYMNIPADSQKLKKYITSNNKTMYAYVSDINFKKTCMVCKNGEWVSRKFGLDKLMQYRIAAQKDYYRQSNKHQDMQTREIVDLDYSDDTVKEMSC